MVIATLLLICLIPQEEQARKAQTYSAPTEERTISPADKPEGDTALGGNAALGSGSRPKIQPAADLRALVAPGQPVLAPKLAAPKPRETPRQRKIWYALSAAGHAGAALDAWSTRRAISSGAGSESNPMLRPFAHSNALYLATQASPFLMDFLGKKMLSSPHKWVRKMWWLPQAAGTGSSFLAGGHNLSLAR